MINKLIIILEEIIDDDYILVVFFLMFYYNFINNITVSLVYDFIDVLFVYK